MLFKQGTGDPSDFEHFLCCENTKPGTVIRYVGNRFNVLFYLAGSFILSSKRDYVLLQKQVEV